MSRPQFWSENVVWECLGIKNSQTPTEASDPKTFYSTFKLPDDRTCVADFHLALKAVDGLLAKYSAIKQDATGAKWRGQSPLCHLDEHAAEHLHKAVALLIGEDKYCGEPVGEEDLLSTACRALMALQLYLEAKAAQQEQAPPKA